MDSRLESFKTTQQITEIVNFIGAPFAFCVQLFFTCISTSMNSEVNKVLKMNFEIFVFGITHLSIIILVALGIASICITKNLVKLSMSNASSDELKRKSKSLQILRLTSLLSAVIGLISILITLFRGSFDGERINIEYSIPVLLCFSPVWVYFIVECISTSITFIKLKKYSKISI